MLMNHVDYTDRIVHFALPPQRSRRLSRAVWPYPVLGVRYRFVGPKCKIHKMS
jgi:hypothetical protein